MFKYNRMAVFNFIVAHKMSHDGNSPSVRDIMREFEMASSSVAQFVVDDLVRMGRLRKPAPNARGRRASRGIEVAGGAWSFSAPERAQ
jgi:hypothetical protein